MKIDKAKVKRILVITLSNVGDIILTTPVVKTLELNFPDSRIDVMVGPNGKVIFEKDPAISKVIVYDKHSSVAQKRRLSAKLRRLKYDLVVDLRNTIFGLLLGPRYRTSTVLRFPKRSLHKLEEHLLRLKELGIEPLHKKMHIYITRQDEDEAGSLLEAAGVRGGFVVVSPGAKSHLKRWQEESFAGLCDRIISETGNDIVFIGLEEDADIVERISKKMKKGSFNFVNKTNLRSLAALMRRAKAVITNDSAPLHLACAVGIPVVALFGPTDPARYGPTGKHDIVVKKDIACAPCEVNVCRMDYACMRSIKPDEVFAAAKELL